MSALDALPMPGDEVVPRPGLQATHATTIAAPPAAVWPWLAQMGTGRGGFYSLDLIDNAGRASARELHPQWTGVRAGDLVPAGRDGWHMEVLQADPPDALVLGVRRPSTGRHGAVWAFRLVEAEPDSTRLLVRVRADAGGRAAVALLRPGHSVMQRVQLRNLARRAEGRARTGWRDTLAGLGGAAAMGAALATPGRRDRRTTWGADADLAAASLPGDDLVPAPRWSWTHSLVADAPAEAVWPWIAQIGADRAGFYSYTWLENLIGCGIRDAERVHPEWQARPGDGLVLHPSSPPLTITEMAEGRHLVAHAAGDDEARAAGRPWTAASWLIAAEPLGPGRSRIVSRFRCDHSDHLSSRLGMGAPLLEPIGGTMDRRMLHGIARRATATATAGVRGR